MRKHRRRRRWPFLLITAGLIGQWHFGYLPALRVIWDELPGRDPLLWPKVWEQVVPVQFAVCFFVSLIGSVTQEQAPSTIRLMRKRRHHQIYGETWQPLWERNIIPP